MEEKINPTNILKEGESYMLVDKDYLIIQALRDLTHAINRLRAKV